MKDVEAICSLESKLFFILICSVEIRPSLKVIWPWKSHAEIPEKDECIIRNMAKMNIQIFSEANKSKKTPQLAKKDRSADVKYQLSRYTPAVKDVMEVSDQFITFTV